MAQKIAFEPAAEVYQLGGIIVDLIMRLVRSKALPGCSSDCCPAYVAGISLIRMMRLSIGHFTEEEGIELLFQMAESVDLKTELSHGGKSRPASVSETDLDIYAEILGKEVYQTMYEKAGPLYYDVQLNYVIIYASIVCLTTEVSVAAARSVILDELSRQFLETQ